MLPVQTRCGITSSLACILFTCKHTSVTVQCSVPPPDLETPYFFFLATLTDGSHATIFMLFKSICVIFDVTTRCPQSLELIFLPPPCGSVSVASCKLSVSVEPFGLDLPPSDIVDIKPANMEELTEVITAAEFHPNQCNTFVYSSSKGTIRLCDMRASALCDKHAKSTSLTFEPFKACGA